MKNELKFGLKATWLEVLGFNWRIDKFWDLIELGINLINEIRDLIEEIPKFGAN